MTPQAPLVRTNHTEVSGNAPGPMLPPRYCRFRERRIGSPAPLLRPPQANEPPDRRAHEAARVSYRAFLAAFPSIRRMNGGRVPSSRHDPESDVANTLIRKAPAVQKRQQRPGPCPFTRLVHDPQAYNCIGRITRFYLKAGGQPEPRGQDRVRKEPRHADGDSVKSAADRH